MPYTAIDVVHSHANEVAVNALEGKFWSEEGGVTIEVTVID